jgi:hypothetical protein
MSWEIFKQNMLRTLNSPESLTDLDVVADKWAKEYDAAVKRGFDTINQVTLKQGNVEIMKQLIKLALLKGQTSQTPYDLVGEMGKAVQAYWSGAIMNEFPIPLIPAPGSIQNVSVVTNLVTSPGVWAPALSVPGLPIGVKPPDTPADIVKIYENLDFSNIPVDVNSDVVQDIINPDLGEIGQLILNDPEISLTDDLGATALTQLDNVTAEILDNALEEQGQIQEETEEEKEEFEKLESSGYKTLDELLKDAGSWARKLGKNARVKYENLRSGYISGVHGLCPQGTQAVVVALTGIQGLGTISGNADWFSFASKTTGGGRSSFAINVGGKTYYNDKVKVDKDFITNPAEWQIGDIVVMGYTSEYPYGHIQVWTGWNWVSDFTQKAVQQRKVDFNTIALWRLNENGKEAVKSRKA